MRQNYKRCTIIIVVSKEIRESHIRKVSHPAHHSLLYRPGIRSHPQHLQIVIRFHHQHVATAQVIANAQRYISEVGGDSNLDSFRAEREPHWVGGVVRNGERLHRDIAHLKCMSRLEALEPFQLRSYPVLIPHGACPCLLRRSRHENRNAQLLRESSQSVNMIAVLVGDQNRRKRMRIVPQRLHSLERLAARDAGIDQDLRRRTRNERAIPPAPRRQHGYTYTHVRQHTRPGCEFGSYFLVSPIPKSRLSASGFRSPDSVVQFGKPKAESRKPKALLLLQYVDRTHPLLNQLWPCSHRKLRPPQSVPMTALRIQMHLHRNFCPL